MERWGDQPMFNDGGGGSQSSKEVRWITLCLCGLVAIVIAGVFFPFVDSLMTWIIVGTIAIGFVYWVCGRLHEASLMYHALHDDPETIMKQDYPNYEPPE